MRFRSRELEGRHSDLLFSASLRNRDESSAYFYLLLEHQSSNDADMPLRVLVYMTRIWDRHRKKDPSVALPIIVPLVVSHAPGGWTSPTSMREMFDPAQLRFEGISAHTPDFELLVDDLKRFSDDDIRKRVVSLFAQLALWLFRDARSASSLMSQLPRWASAFTKALGAHSGPEALHQLLRYIALVTDDMQFDAFHAKLVELAPEAEEPVMTIAEELHQKGLAKGRAEGLEKGLRRTLIKQLTLKFRAINDAFSARIETASDAQLDLYLERVLTADTLEAVFAE